MTNVVFDHTTFLREYVQKHLSTGTLQNRFFKKFPEVPRKTPAPKSYFSPFFPAFFTKTTKTVNS